MRGRLNKETKIVSPLEIAQETFQGLLVIDCGSMTELAEFVNYNDDIWSSM